MTYTIKERLHRPGIIRCMAVGRILHHNMLQIIGMHGGYHGLWFDIEHCNTSINDLEICAMAARSQGLDSFCRVAPTDYALVTRCLEAGTSGVMAAQINTVEQADEFVQWAKFHPRGWRGLNNGGFDGRYGAVPIQQYCEESNERTLVAIQIETAQSVEHCEAIAAIDGVDMLFVGPSDLSQNLGVTGEFFHEKCIAAIERVGKACRDSGKHWGAVCTSPEHAAMMLENGCKLLSPINDSRMVVAGLEAIRNRYESLFADTDSE